MASTLQGGENQLTAPEVAKLFFEHWVRFFGVPKYVIHDRDVHFVRICTCVILVMFIVYVCSVNIHSCLNCVAIVVS